jgi:hypothetical protein
VWSFFPREAPQKNGRRILAIESQGVVRMPRARSGYELLVGRHVSPATLATFPVPFVPRVVPRKTVYRLRVGAGIGDIDIADIVRRLTERDVTVLEIRRCPERSWSRPGDQRAAEAADDDGGDDDDGVVVAFRPRADTPRRTGEEPTG